MEHGENSVKNNIDNSKTKHENETSTAINKENLRKIEKHVFDTMRIKNVKTPVLQTIGKYEIKLRRGAKIMIGQNDIPVNEL